jgi:putative ABC transport system permease protein
MQTYMQDLRYGIRMLLKTPGYTLIAVATLALGIGANTAIFSVVNAVLLRPLPYPESERLVWLSERGTNFPTMSIAYPNFIDYRAQQTVFEKIGVYNLTSYNLTGRGEPRRLEASRISADAFAALRVQAAVGRVFSNEDDKAGAPPVAVLSHSAWQTHFGGDAGIVNQSITLNAHAYTVVGVMGADFAYPSRVDIWTPVGQMANDPSYQSRGNHPGLMGVARLKPGVPLEQARAEMDGIAARLEQQRRAAAPQLLSTTTGQSRFQTRRSLEFLSRPAFAKIRDGRAADGILPQPARKAELAAGRGNSWFLITTPPGPQRLADVIPHRGSSRAAAR